MLGIVLIIGAIALFFLDKIKPGYERDSDKIYAVLGLLSGIFLLAHLTMELVPAFQQIMMVGMVITLMVQNIRARTPRDSRAVQAGGYDEPIERDRYRPSRPSSRSTYRSEMRTNLRAELDRGGYDDDPRLPRERPMLGSRDNPDLSQDGYRRDDYAERYPEDDRPVRRDRYDSEAPYSGASRNPRNDERVRRPRPSSRNRPSGRYLLEPGNPAGQGLRPPREN